MPNTTIIDEDILLEAKEFFMPSEEQVKEAEEQDGVLFNHYWEDFVRFKVRGKSVALQMCMHWLYRETLAIRQLSFKTTAQEFAESFNFSARTIMKRLKELEEMNMIHVKKIGVGKIEISMNILHQFQEFKKYMKTDFYKKSLAEYQGLTQENEEGMYL